MATILKIIYSDKPNVYVTKVNKRTVITEKAISKLLSDKQCNDILSIKDAVERAVSIDVNAKVVEIDLMEAFMESMQINPVFVVTEGNEETGLKPYHHCFAYGDYVFGVIWDTRMLDVIVPMNDIDYSKCKFMYHDNGRNFKTIAGRFDDALTSAIHSQLPTNLSESQIAQIQL